jgi:hypothetical protein
MPASQSVVLIAVPSPVVSKLNGGLDERVEVIAAETYDDAVACVGERHVDLLVVCYVFDNVRPYRLLNQLQDLNKLPVSMLVRALPIPLREEEQEVRRAMHHSVSANFRTSLTKKGATGCKPHSPGSEASFLACCSAALERVC